MQFIDIIFKSNITRLIAYLKNAPESNKASINEVIRLYEDRKIGHITTALNTVASLASTNKIQLIRGNH